MSAFVLKLIKPICSFLSYHQQACIAAGVEVAKLSRWLGHCNVSTTYNMYVRPRLSDLADGAVPIIDDAMKGM